MVDAIARLFGSASFLPHGHCFAWDPPLLWTYVAADSLTGLAYFSIPAAIWHVVRRRPDIPFQSMAVMFSVFILACGTTHFIAVLDLWVPDYWLDAAVKTVTAAASVATAALLWPLVPRALAMPNPEELEALNRALQSEIRRRLEIESELQAVNLALEERVAQRTAELETTNAALHERNSERDRAERAREESQQLLQSILDNATPMVAVRDLDGRYLATNLRFQSAFHVTQDMLAGKTDVDVFPKVVADEYQRIHRRVIEVEQPVETDTVALLDDGWHDFLTVEFPIRDAAGRLHAVGAIATDITERKRAENSLRASQDALRQSEERMLAVVESVLHGLVVVDAAGRIELVNRQLEAMFGYDRQELVGRSIAKLIPESQREHHGEHIAGFFRQPSRRDMAQRRELHGRRRDGSQFPLEIGLNPMTEGESLRVLATVTDVSERVGAQQRIERALEEKSVLLSEIHHRVKNNLQVISSLLKMQARTVTPQVGEVLTESRSRVEAMATIHQLLYEQGDMSRIEIGAYLKRLIGLLAETYGDRNRAVALRLEVGHGPYRLDMQQAIACGLVVNELVTNAFKHAFPGARTGTIAVSLVDVGSGRLVLAVADDGVGLPAGVEIGRTTTLGLRLLPTLAEQLGAELTLSRDKGTRYELAFEP